MIYAYDEPVQLPVRDLYDTQMMAMAINAAKDMYEKGYQLMKDFSKEYGDFMTPITADLDWYNENVTGKVRGIINSLYQLGIDPLRNPLGRMLIARAIGSMPYGDIAKLKQSAENAREYLKEKAKLEASGLYNPNTEKYAGLGLDQFSTIDNGVWDRMSPVPYLNMADFSKSFFDNIQPFQRAGTKNGISYSISEINMNDLHNIADQHFNDLVQTPQGRLMYLMYKDLLGSEEAARKAFNDAVVSGNIDRLRYADDYDKRVKEEESLALQRSSNALQWAKFNWDKAKEKEELEIKRIAAENKGGRRGDGSEENRNYYQDLFDRGLLKFTYGEAGDPPQTDLLVNKNSRNVLIASKQSTKELASVKDYNTEEWSTARDRFLEDKVARGIISPSVLVRSSKRPVDNTRNDCVFASSGDIDRMYDADEIVSSTFGAKGSKGRRFTNNSTLDEYRAGKSKSDKLKMQFTDETYTAPITKADGTVRMVQYQKVYLYEKTSDSSDKLVGERWYRIASSEPTKGEMKNGKRHYRKVATSLSGDDSGYMQEWGSEAEHILHSTSEGKYNDLVRY